MGGDGPLPPETLQGAARLEAMIRSVFDDQMAGMTAARDDRRNDATLLRAVAASTCCAAESREPSQLQQL
eukprot:5272531-Prymnesium_polylepis.1